MDAVVTIQIEKTDEAKKHLKCSEANTNVSTNASV